MPLWRFIKEKGVDKNMLWGFFTLTHIITLIIAMLIIIGLYFLLKRMPEKLQIVILGILSFSGIGAIIFNLTTWGSPLEYLPFHLCSIVAILLPITVFTKSKVLGNLLLLWALGALAAIIVNNAQANYEIFSWTFFFYYVPHTLEFGITVLLFALGLIKLDAKCIVSTIILTMLIYTLVHFINLGVNAYCIKNEIVDYAGNIIQVNYMYSLVPENPIFALFYQILPYKYWYLYMSIPIIALYLGAIYLGNGLYKKIKAKKEI